MNSKEALETLFASYNFDGNYHDLIIAREKLEQDLDRLEKLEKALDILKDKFEIVAITKDYDGFHIIDTCCYFVYINKEEYELLKEVLGDD